VGGSKIFAYLQRYQKSTARQWSRLLKKAKEVWDRMLQAGRHHPQSPPSLCIGMDEAFLILVGLVGNIAQSNTMVFVTASNKILW